MLREGAQYLFSFTTGQNNLLDYWSAADPTAAHSTFVTTTFKTLLSISVDAYIVIVTVIVCVCVAGGDGLITLEHRLTLVWCSGLWELFSFFITTKIIQVILP